MSSFIAGLQELLRTNAQLPTLPVIVFQLHAALEREHVSAGEIVDLIERDPALAARTLRAANSALYARGGDPIASIQGAVGRLGLNQIRSMCMVLAVVKAFGDRGAALDHQRFWEHSAAVGLTAERLARVIDIPREVEGTDVYVAGLLHDVGHLVLDQFFPEQFAGVGAALAEESVASWRIEEEQLGMDHGEIGGLLLGRWSLPPAVISAVTHHHRPEKADEKDQIVCRLVWAAESLCSATGLDLPQEGMAEVPPHQVFEALGVPQEERKSILQDVGSMGERAAQYLS